MPLANCFKSEPVSGEARDCPEAFSATFFYCTVLGGPTAWAGLLQAAKGAPNPILPLDLGQRALAWTPCFGRHHITVRTHRKHMVEIAWAPPPWDPVVSAGMVLSPELCPSWNSHLLAWLILFRPQGNTSAQHLHCVLKTKGDYLWMPWKFVGCTSSDLGDDHCFGARGNLSSRGLGERKDKITHQPFLPDSTNARDSQVTKYHFPLMLHVPLLVSLYVPNGGSRGTPWWLRKTVKY